MGQLSFSSLSRKERPKSRVHRFLSEMDEAIMWKKIVKVIKPYYYTGKMGRKPLPLELMLRIYFLQQWFSNCAYFSPYFFPFFISFPNQ